MIKFFRKIRQKLLSENRFRKYLIYAIGEIILVVIGIMIALQVNNWNNEREKDEKTRAIFSQIIDELIIDVQVIKNANNYYFYKDSLIEAYKKIDPKKIPRQSDSELDDFDLIDMIRTFAPMDIHDRGFNLLMNQADQMDEQYKPYIDELVYLYQDSKTMVDLYNQRILNLLKEHRMHKIENHAWYSRIHTPPNKRYEDEFKYYKYDPIYKNYVKYYNEMIWNIVTNARVFEDLAIKFCRKANRDFGLNKNVDKKLSFHYPPNEIIESIIGKYKLDGQILTFKKENNQLYESTYDNKDLIYIFEKEIKVGELRYLGDSTFYRNVIHNLRLKPDGTLCIINMANRSEIVLKPISND